MFVLLELKKCKDNSQDLNRLLVSDLSFKFKIGACHGGFFNLALNI